MIPLGMDRALRLSATLWTGVMAGFFWSFSTVVMPGLTLAEPLTALPAMQAINIAVRNTMFAVGFFGTPLLCLLVVLRSATRRDRNAAFALTGGLAYIGGTFLLTVFGNVPLNRELAQLDPQVAESGAAMLAYIRDWTSLNHLRTVAALTAFVLLAISLAHPPPPTEFHGSPAQ